MPSSGSGTGTPISGGVPSGASHIEPLPYTLLALARYARIVGITPPHFWRATAATLSTPVFPVTGCSSVWPRHSWQNFDQTSQEELAYAIQGAEEDISKIVGYYPAPMWVSAESHQYPRPFDPTVYDGGLDLRGRLKGVQLKHGRFVSAGRRNVALVGTATVAGGTLVYSDEDTDGLFETATITLPTALTVACEIKPYFSGFSGDQEWEVRPLRSVSISGGNVVMVMDAWLLIDPELLAAYPTTDGFRAIDISTTGNYVTSVDVYREYTDFTQASSQFIWEPSLCCSACGGVGCAACELTTQDGCAYARNFDLGIVAPTPASYNSTTGEWDVATEWTGCVEPEQVKIWYYAGDRSSSYLSGRTCDPLSDWWAQTIAWIATARLERPPCGCVSNLHDQLSRDLSLARSGETYFNPVEVLRNPLGTRRGEVMAWRRISKLVEKIPHYALV